MRLILLFSLLLLPSCAATGGGCYVPTTADGYTRYPEPIFIPDPNQEQSVPQPTSSSAPITDDPNEYHAIQLLHGFGAIGVGLAQPTYLRPKKRVLQCMEGQAGVDAAVVVPWCFVGGVFEGLFFTLRDWSAGLVDVATGGYWRVSERVGVFE